MDIVAGLSLRNLKPRVWDPASPYYLRDLGAVMVSYAEFKGFPARIRDIQRHGSLRKYLGVPDDVEVYLDNGAFFFSARNEIVDHKEYQEFVSDAGPDWRPVPQDFIPLPSMSLEEQRSCLQRTMAVNAAFEPEDYVPVVHVSAVLPEYITAVQENANIAGTKALAIGGIVPHLLRRRKAHRYEDVLDRVKQARTAFDGKHLHLFGVGGTATLHLASLLRMDSVDSSGWRNRAARGMIQLPGTGERTVVGLGKWRGREPSAQEWAKLKVCQCPACALSGVAGLQETGISGFSNRATHNLWTLLQEAKWIEEHTANGTYAAHYSAHLDNTVYRPLIDHLVAPAQAGARREAPPSEAV